MLAKHLGRENPIVLRVQRVIIIFTELLCVQVNYLLHYCIIVELITFLSILQCCTSFTTLSPVENLDSQMEGKLGQVKGNSCIELS